MKSNILRMKEGRVIEFDCSLLEHICHEDVHICLLEGQKGGRTHRMLASLNEGGEILWKKYLGKRRVNDKEEHIEWRNDHLFLNAPDNGLHLNPYTGESYR